MTTVQQAKDAANEIYDLLSKPKQKQALGALNDLFLFLEQKEREEKEAAKEKAVEVAQ